MTDSLKPCWGEKSSWSCICWVSLDTSEAAPYLLVRASQCTKSELGGIWEVTESLLDTEILTQSSLQIFHNLYNRREYALDIFQNTGVLESDWSGFQSQLPHPITHVTLIK